jgi:hypothetical protein
MSPTKGTLELHITVAARQSSALGCYTYSRTIYGQDNVFRLNPNIRPQADEPGVGPSPVALTPRRLATSGPARHLDG